MAKNGGQPGEHESQNDRHKVQSQKSSSTIISSLCSGAAAGYLFKSKFTACFTLINFFSRALAKTTIAPLDRTKIYFQTHPGKLFYFFSTNVLKSDICQFKSSFPRTLSDNFSFRKTI